MTNESGGSMKKRKIKKIIGGVIRTVIPTYGYSKTLVQSGLYKLHSSNYAGQGVRVVNIGPGLELSPYLSEMEHRIRRVSVIDDKPFEGQKDYHDNMVAQLFLTYIPKIGNCPKLERYTVVKMKDVGGSWTPSTLSKALDYILNLPTNELPHLVSMSFGISSINYESGQLRPLDTSEYSFNQCKIKFERLKAMGVKCFASSGNNGQQIPDWPASFLESVGCKTFNETRHFNSNKAKWIYYGHEIDVFGADSKPRKVELTSYACPQLVGAIASYLSKKIFQGFDPYKILNCLELNLKDDGHLVETIDGLSLKF